MSELKKNDIVELVCTAYGSDGMGVARVNGMAVFVAGAVAGEKCRARILKVLKNAAFAKVESVLEPSPDRIAPDCPYYPACGGCDTRHMTYAEELRFKRHKVEDALRRIGGADISVDIIYGAEHTERYRNKAQFPVSGGKIGFYRGRSHDVLDAADCLLQSVSAGTARGAVKDWMERFDVPSYNERSGTGLVRHLYVRTSSKGESLVCLVVNGKAERPIPHEKELVDILRSALPGLAGVVVNSNVAKTNVILGDGYRTAWGRAYLEETLCGLTFRLSVPSFFQVNRVQCEVLYERAIAMAQLTGRETVLDLYCGIGTISLCLAKNAAKVIGAEIVTEAIEDAKANSERNGIKNADFTCGDASAVAGKLAADGIKPDVVVVDPPRRGLAEDVIRSIAAMNPERVVYVSCDCATLARDTKVFHCLGYDTKTVEAVDMFPRTHHVETVVLMSKVGVEYV